MADANGKTCTEATKLLALDLLGNDATQTRAELRQQAINEYADKLREGDVLDPAIAYQDGCDYFLSAGFHRREAYRAAGKKEMPCIVRKGSKWDAIQAGIQDNSKHVGERLTRNDKRHIVRLILELQPAMSDRQIADLAQVSHGTVGRIRENLVSTGQIDQLDKRT